MSNVGPDFENFRSPKFVDIARIRRVRAAIENSVVNGAGEKSRVHRPESRIWAWQSMGFHAIAAGVTISPSSFEGLKKKTIWRPGRKRGEHGERRRNVLRTSMRFHKNKYTFLLDFATNCLDRDDINRLDDLSFVTLVYFIQSLTVLTQFVIKRFFEHKENT